jgi:putative transposase
VRTHGTIVIEDLRRRRHGKSSLGSPRRGCRELRRQVEYKTGWSGVRLRYPSSKTCSYCAAVKTKLRLSERTASLLAAAGIVVYRARKLS